MERVERLERDGYAIADAVLTSATCEEVSGAIPAVIARRGGVRDLIGTEIVARILRSHQVREAVSLFLDAPFVAVKATLFDKTADANWRVQWHQDRTISVKQRRETAGSGPWTMKGGVPHVEPPTEVLRSMIAMRIQLDPCGPENGPLKVVPGSHTRGKLSPEAIAAVVAEGRQTLLALPQGSILFMRPLLVHASSPAERPQHRRVLHIEFAPEQAIMPLEWHKAVAVSAA
jgi:ectoine hydroxylase-related dioxygenase (phytanoyl-CoA dioxygenase family)